MSNIKSVWSKFIEGSDGLPLAGASVTVTDETTGSLATIYSDRAGTAETNPVTSDANGLATFYADSGVYQIVATSGAFTATLRYQSIGESSQTDKVYISAGAPTSGDDDASNFLIGQIWQDTATSPSDYYICDDNSTGAAVWRIMNIYPPSQISQAKEVTTITGTSHTIVDANNGCILYFTNGSTVTLEIPAAINAGDGESTGFNCEIIQGGAGVVDWSAAAATVNDLTGGDEATNGQYSVVYLRSVADDVYITNGDTA